MDPPAPLGHLPMTALQAVVLAAAGWVAAGAANCIGGVVIDGIQDSYLMGDRGIIEDGRLTLRHNSGFSVTKSCQNGDWDPFGFTPFHLLGKTLSFTVNLSRVGCGCNLALYLVRGPARNIKGEPSRGECSWSPYYCDANKVCNQWCPEMDIMEANNRVFASTPHKCDAPTSEGHYSNCDRSGCTRNTNKMGGAAYGPGDKYKIDSRRPFEVHASFHGSAGGAGEGGPSFTGMTTTLSQGGHEVSLDFSGCSSYLGELAGVMAEGMSMRITYWGGAASTMSWLDQPPCGEESCSGSNAGEAVIGNIRVTSSCDREIAVRGLGEAAFVSGNGGHASGDRLVMRHNSGFSLTTTCQDHWDPNSFTMLKLLGRTLSYTVDISQVGCSCNLALYLINGPAKDEAGNPSLGTCPWSPYYCDANKVCGQWCPEVDIMEANSRAYASTPHKCDDPSSAGHYSTCDRNGCGQSTRNLDQRAYGPGNGYRINTMHPFRVHASFHAEEQPDGRVRFSGLTLRLQQDSNELVLDHSHCGKYLDSLTQPMMEGMAMRITYWGNDAETMAWLDQPPCGEATCSGLNAGQAVISNMTISGAASTARAAGEGGTGWFTPWWIFVFVLLSCLQCSFLFGLGIYAVSLYQRWHPPPEVATMSPSAAATQTPPATSRTERSPHAASPPVASPPDCYRSRSAMLLP